MILTALDSLHTNDFEYCPINLNLSPTPSIPINCRYAKHTGQTFLSLTRFVEILETLVSSNKFYENRFNDLPNDDTNYDL
jgi:hypothetical protein